METIVRHNSSKSEHGSLFARYLKDISGLPLLSLEQERELGRRAQSGDVLAKQKLVESNLRFVIKVAKEFSRKPDSLMELVSAGNLGLTVAASRFDPEMNVKFTTYAVWWIRQAIFQHLAAQSHPFRVPPKVANILYRMARTILESVEIQDRERYAAQIGVHTEELESALAAVSNPVFLDDKMLKRGNSRMSDLLEDTRAASPEEIAMIQSLRRSLEKSLGQLNPLERMVIRMRFGFDDHSPLTLKAVGLKLNRSRERIRQIEKNALKRLKNIYLHQASSNSFN